MFLNSIFIYIFKSQISITLVQGEYTRPKSENDTNEGNILLQLYKDQGNAGQAGSPNKFSKVLPQLPTQSSHAHPYKPEPNLLEMNYPSKTEGLTQTSTSTPSSPYVGGPNITPLYHKITGELVMDSNRSDSSSTSGTDSSPTHSHFGRYETSKN